MRLRRPAVLRISRSRSRSMSFDKLRTERNSEFRSTTKKSSKARTQSRTSACKLAIRWWCRNRGYVHSAPFDHRVDGGHFAGSLCGAEPIAEPTELNVPELQRRWLSQNSHG